MVQETDSVVEKISTRSDRALGINVRYPTILTRNLLITLGANAVAGRVGMTAD